MEGYVDRETYVQETLKPYCTHFGECNYLVFINHYVIVGLRSYGHYQLMESVGLSPNDLNTNQYQFGVFRLEEDKVKIVKYNNGRDYDDGTVLRNAVMSQIPITSASVI